VASSTFTRRDLNRFRKVYPYLRYNPIYIQTTTAANTFIIEASKITFTNASSGSYTFTSVYSTVPTVVATAVDSAGNGTANVNVFITAISLTSVTVGTSQNFTGEVHVQVLYVGS
jgi:hypothetical protein